MAAIKLRGRRKAGGKTFVQKISSKKREGVLAAGRTGRKLKRQARRSSPTRHEVNFSREGYAMMMPEAQRWLAAIVESSDDAIIGLDSAGKIISSNKGAFRLYGYKPEEMIGRSVRMLMPADIRDELQKIFEHIRRDEMVMHYETVRRHKDGRRIDVSLTISPIKDAHGEIIGASKIARDITERKRAEKQLGDILAREKAAREAAEAANRAKDDFLAALSHELRTPLNPVLLLASEAARNTDLPPGIRTDFDTIRKNIELEARLIDDLLDLTRITHGRIALNQSELDVHGVLNDAISTVLNEIEEKRLALKLNLTAEHHKIFGDAVRIQQIFWNILKNAVKFSHEGGRITVGTRSGGGQIAVSVSDTGIGMSEGERARAFLAFSQGTEHFGGLGLGLAISRALAELHAGSISAESQGKGKGATFVVKLPLTPPPEVGTNQRRQARTTGQRAAGAGNAHGRRVQVLLVEDHEVTRTTLTKLLMRRRFQVAEAGSLAEARSQMEKHSFNLLISDIGLPDGSGNDLMAEFKNKFHGKGIALTGYGMDEDVERSRLAGFAAHLTKPIRIESLEHALAAIEGK